MLTRQLTRFAPVLFNGGQSLTAQGQTLYVAEGDSITSGQLNTANNSYAKLWKNEFPGRINFVNQAVSGSRIADLEARAAATDALLTSTAEWSSSKVLSVFVGTNELYTITPAATFLASLAAYCDARRAAGWKVLVGTILPRGDYITAEWNAWKATVNAGILTWVGVHCDALMDFASSPLMGNFSDTADASKYIDGLHPTDLGQTYLYSVVRSALNALTTVTTPAAQYTAWNPSDKHVDLSLSGSNFIVGSNATPATFRSVRSVNGRESGKYYTEFSMSGSNDQILGVVDKLQSLSSYFQAATSCVFYANFYVFVTSFTLVNAIGWTYAVTDILGVVVDFDAGKFWFHKNGTYTAGADPATGANPNYTFPPNTMLWLGASLKPTAATCQLPANSGGLSYPVPAGYLVY